MATTYQIKGGQSVVWGIDDTVAFGTITDVSADIQAAIENNEGQHGEIVGVVIYDETISIKLSVVAKATGTPPQVGDVLTIDPDGSVIKALVTGVNSSRSHKGKKKWEITAMAGPNFNPETTQA